MRFNCWKLLTVGVVATLATNAFAGDADDVQQDMRASVADEMRIMDANLDSRISAAEHAVGAKLMFRRMDRNRDNRVTAAEMDAAKQPSKAHESSGTRHPTPPEMSAADKIRVVDVDGDGVLTAQEHQAASTQMFARMDADTDGLLTAKEVEAGHASMLRSGQ